MKIKIFTIIISLVVISCSKDSTDDSADSSNQFVEISVDGEAHKNDGLIMSSGRLNTKNCKGGDLEWAFQEDFETSQYRVALYFVYPAQSSEMANSSYSNTGITSEISNWEQDDFCHNLFDIVVTYIEKSSSVSMKASGENHSNIKTIRKIGEDSEDVHYLVEGDFKIIYEREDGTLIPITGKYNMPFYVSH